MSTPVRSFVGGIGLALSVHSLLLLNGSVLGISGFLHRAVRGNKEAIASVAGLVLGGAVATGGLGPPEALTAGPGLIISGLLVGLGTRLANGCTSGHMICGLSRFSLRSIAATATFFTTAVATTYAMTPSLTVPGTPDYTLGPDGQTLLALHAVPFLVSAALYFFSPAQKSPAHEAKSPRPASTLRIIASFTTAFNFALALRLSNMTQPARVISFLVLPFHAAFDPSLFFLATSALPLSIALYRYGRGREQPRLGGPWSIPKGGDVDLKLVAGSALFGVGWAMGGVCPGPSLVNLGNSFASGLHVSDYATWLVSFIAGGLFV
ncbi:hypothetical protein PLICRDRAFT_124671 [Plicaturopsis crispa FD-325 SS-3]|nr:hypothetical protein PLICRDRAFT_124671 [Plicaturopsis crispa FD-325 SS-3]